jgi:predicted dithiol-disulfide oxidoreductase (DUF899 family)
MHDKRFPGETAAWRAARDELLGAERELRRQVEAVAAQRRRLPLGAVVPEDYVFDGETGPVRLSELFAPGQDTLVLYSFMFGGTETVPCPMCTSFLDGLNGQAAHITQRASLAVCARAPIADVLAYGRGRGWDALRLVSSAKNHFNRDFNAEEPSGDQNTVIHVFVKRDDSVHHFYSSELEFLPADPDQNQRHIDLLWPLWNVLDLTPAGRGTDWFPKRSYD